MANFAAKWFALYYPILGGIFLVVGIGVMIKTDAIVDYFVAESKSEQPPAIPRTILKYFFLFTLPCLVLSLFPFSWPELLFSLWSLIMVYIIGIQLVHWPQNRKTIMDYPAKIHWIIKIAGAIMLALSPVIFLLGYHRIQPFLPN